jgi:AcrR family transcriptional regulator
MSTNKEKKGETALTEKPRRNAAETRKRILGVARTLFSKDVYRNVGTRDIAAAAGVNLTLINRYFGSKKQLFREVALSMSNIALSPGGEEFERKVMEDLLAEEDNPRKEKLRLLLLSSMDSEVSDVVSEFFRERQKRGQATRESDHETRAFLRLASLVGIALTFTLLPEEDRAQLDKSRILDHFVKSIKEP